MAVSKLEMLYSDLLQQVYCLLCGNLVKVRIVDLKNSSLRLELPFGGKIYKELALLSLKNQTKTTFLGELN